MKTRHDLVIDSTSQVSVLTKNQCVFRHVADIRGEGSHHRAQYRLLDKAENGEPSEGPIGSLLRRELSLASFHSAF